MKLDEGLTTKTNSFSFLRVQSVGDDSARLFFVYGCTDIPSQKKKDDNDTAVKWILMTLTHKHTADTFSINIGVCGEMDYRYDGRILSNN